MTRTPQVLSQAQISSINEKAKLPAYGPILTIGLLFVALIIMFNITFFAGVIAFILGYVFVSPVRRRDRTRKTTELTYNQTSSRFAAIQGACQKLAETHSIWYIGTEQENLDRRRQAGADNLIERKLAVVKPSETPLISTDVVVWGVNVEKLKILFFPDTILVWEQEQYTRVSYESFDVVFHPTRFIEPSPPKDAEIVGHTWQYVNQNGGPDRRFNNNRQIPIALYGLLVMTGSSGFKSQLHVSNRSLAADFATDLSKILNLHSKRQRHNSESRQRDSGQRSQTRSKSQQKKTKPPTGEKAQNVPSHEVLQVPPNPTKEQIVAGYRKMAQMYHPDKVSGLGPEFRELAEVRMKEINAAYTELLKKTAG